jgi:hypothetical protein
VRVDRPRRWSYLPVLVAVVLQLVLLYAPSSGGVSPFPNFDKLVHSAMFALPVFFALLARLPRVPVIAVLALHAPVSELIQWTLLPNRSGDPWDVVADLVGVTLGAAAAHLVLNREQPERW